MADRRVRIVWEFETKHQHCAMRCGGCGRTVILPPKEAVRVLGALTDVGLLEKRLRCLGCGAKQAQVSGVWREYHG